MRPPDQQGDRGAPRMPAEPFPRFGKYQLVRRLGQGPHVETFLGRLVGPHGVAGNVVIRRVRREALARAPGLAAALGAEARVGAALDHPHIVRVTDSGVVDGSPYVCTEYVAGEHLDAILRQCAQQKRQIPMGVALWIASSALQALEYAHGAGVCHGTVCPSNVMIGYEGGLKLLDFGASRATFQRCDTLVGDVPGQVSYVAPEQVRGEPADARTDLWGVGLTLFEALTNQRLFMRASQQEVINAILEEPLPTADAFRPEISTELAAVARRALQRDRKRRQPSAAVMRAELEAAGARLAPAATGPDVAAFMAALFPENVRREKTGLAAAGQLPTLASATVSADEAGPIVEEATPVTMNPLELHRRTPGQAAADLDPPAWAGAAPELAVPLELGDVDSAPVVAGGSRRLPVMVAAAAIAIALGAGAWLARSRTAERTPAPVAAVAISAPSPSAALVPPPAAVPAPPAPPTAAAPSPAAEAPAAIVPPPTRLGGDGARAAAKAASRSGAGPLTPREVATTFGRVRSRILDCFTLHGESVAAREGEVTLSLLVLQSGAVQEATITSPPAGSPALDQCIVARAKGVRFRNQPDKELRINVPFVYRVTN